MNERDKEIVEVTTVNPLLEKLNRMPGITFRIPSRGLLYRDGELEDGVIDGEVVVYPLTTLDEIYLKSPDMLFQGSAIEKVFKKRIPQIKKPLELFSNDVDFLLTCLRKVSYGDFIQIRHKCTECVERVEQSNDGEDKFVETQTFDIPLNHFISNTKEICDDLEKGLSFTTSNGYNVNLRPARMKEVLELYRQNNDDENISLEEVEQIFIRSLSSTIDDIDGITDKDLICEWLSALPRNIMEEFKGKIERVNKWGSEFTYTVSCGDCSAKQVISTVLNPLYFFILPSDQGTRDE